MAERIWWPTEGDRVALDDPLSDEQGEVVGDEMNGVVVRWDGGDYSVIAVNELIPLEK